MPHAASPRSQPRAAHLGPERRRPQVLDAALAIAVDRGIGAVTIGAVAAEMGVARTVVYAGFADRVELVEALLTREEQHLVEVVIGALRSSGGAESPEAAFVSGFRSLLDTVTERPDAWRILLSGEPDPAVSARFRAARATVTEAATAWIGPALQAWWGTADLDRKLPALIELFMSSCEAAVRMFLATGPDGDPDELAELYGLAMCRALSGA